MELLKAILQIVNKKWTPVGKCLKYHRSLEENMETLERKLRELNKQNRDIESQMSSQICPRKEPNRQVENWLGEVQSINVEIQKIKEKVEKGKYLSRSCLGHCVAKKIQDVEELHQKGISLERLLHDELSRRGGIFPVRKLVGETTATRKMEEVWDFLMNDEITLIGVYGMGGVGKTTIMKHINNRLVQQGDKFGNVIWFTASKKGLDIIKLQDCIAEELAIDLSGLGDERTRAIRLSTVIEKKRYVLILDDVWEAFNLEDVGIPQPTAANGCNIVLTTRLLDVCQCMNCKVVKMEVLSKDEAWNFFLDIVGRSALVSPSMEATMKLVAEACACLPLAIVTVAGSMKGVEDELEWRNALRKLRGATEGFNGMERVFKSLKFSYLRLKDEKLQHCLLYCALYPEDFEIKREELIKCMINEGIIEQMSRQQEFDMGQVMLNELENACLLKSCTNAGDKKCVKIHDLVRVMALQIMSSQCMVQAGVELRDIPDGSQWTKYLDKVSLMSNNIREIHYGESLRCSKLSTLLLSRNRELRKISSSFFLHMVRLKVLNLSHTSIENLPESISHLENLTALLLRGCLGLKYVPSLAKLKALRTLDLNGTRIVEVPPGMEMLVNLVYLDLNARLLKMLPVGILPKLSRLRCLIIRWESATLKVEAEEVASLRKLETFACQFSDPHDLNIYVRSWQSRPLRYLLQVGPGDSYSWFDEKIGDIYKKVILRKCNIGRGEEPLELPDDIEFLDIKDCHDVICLCDVSSSKIDFLRSCAIESCDGIEYVISSPSLHCLSHQRLEYLRLEKLQNLLVLFMGEGSSPPPPGTFSCLGDLIITDCPNIIKLFTPGLLPHLQSLKKISVNNCEGMDEIIESNSGEEEQIMGEIISHSTVNNDDTITTITLPKLSVLSLRNLPELKSIIYSRGIIARDSLAEIVVHNCPKLKRLPLYLPLADGKPSPPPALRSIVANRGWWELLEWDHPYAKVVLQPFLR